jgi:hypothetical protein
MARRQRGLWRPITEDDLREGLIYVLTHRPAFACALHMSAAERRSVAEGVVPERLRVEAQRRAAEDRARLGPLAHLLAEGPPA